MLVGVPRAPLTTASVPLVGKVNEVRADKVNVRLKAPLVVNAPPRVTDFPPILPTVVEQEPAELVTSLVSAGNCAQVAEPLRLLNVGCAKCGTPLVSMYCTQLFEVCMIDSMPPSAEAVGLGKITV